MKKLLQKILAFFHIPWDKFLHFIVCFGATFLMGIATFFLGQLASMFCGGLFALGLGLGKEYGDSKATGNKWDWWDIVADVIGIGVGSLLVFIAYSIINR